MMYYFCKISMYTELLISGGGGGVKQKNAGTLELRDVRFTFWTKSMYA